MMRQLILGLIFFSCVLGERIKFNKGVNFTNWFQVDRPELIDMNRFSMKDFENIKSLGCDVVRLPINLHAMLDSEMELDPVFLYCLDRAVDMAEESEVHLILDNHSFSSSGSTELTVEDTLLKVWPSMAVHFRNRSELIYYEILNEPHGISDSAWNDIQGKVIEAIREQDTTHTIIVGPAGWNSYHNLVYMPDYEDDNLIYTFHFYDPFLFTHQGASWARPSMESLGGLPFPYDMSRMPECPEEYLGTWLDNALSQYAKDGTIKRVKELIDIAADFQEKRRVTLFCGEFGVYIPNSPAEDRVEWYEIVRNYFEEKGMVWTIWDYREGFGLFEKGSPQLFDYDLNIPLVRALGMNEPPQWEFELKPDKEGFSIYDDFIGPGILEASWNTDGVIDFFHEEGPVKGRFCLHWTDVGRYCAIGFAFSPIKDLSWLRDHDYALDFWVKGDTPGSRFDIRFMDTVDDSTDLPWRSRITVSEENGIVWDGAWRHLRIPLKNFKEHGAWDGAWHDPQGDFDWENLRFFHIVSENHDFAGIHFYFDEMKIVSSEEVSIQEKGRNTSELITYYPNPCENQMTFLIQNWEGGPFTIDIYDLLGRKVNSMVRKGRQGENMKVSMNTAGLTNGIYFYRFKSETDSRFGKIMVSR